MTTKENCHKPIKGHLRGYGLSEKSNNTSAEAMKWQPIDTAPCGVILVIGGELETELGNKYDCVSATKVRNNGADREIYSEYFEVCDTCNYSAWVNNPTYWMPLPEPPIV